MLILIVAVLLQVAPADVTPYDANPEHPWNQLHAALLRPDVPAFDADAFLWGCGDEERSKKALSAFLDDHHHVRISAPVSRALLQRDLWAVFDQVDGRASRHLKQLIADAIRRLALPRSEIERLPLATGNSLPGSDPSWVELRDASDRPEPLAPAHSAALRHRSAFSVYLALPGGRRAAIEYLATLNRFAPILTWREADPPYLGLNPHVPQPPVGTRVALVRRALLVDRSGDPVVSPLVESVQVRTFLRTDPVVWQVPLDGAQSTQAFLLDRRGLLRGDAGLVEVAAEVEVVNVFRERYLGDAVTLPAGGTCGSCHGGTGFLSVNTWKRDESGCATDAMEIPRYERPRLLLSALPDVDVARIAAERAKRDHVTFGELISRW